MSSELVTLLRQQSKIGPINVPRASMRDAAERIEALEAENARLCEALEPFSDIANLIDSETEGMSDTDELELHYHDYLMASWPVSMFRAARRAREGGNADG